ncbi:MAG: amino acid adenylation domain-containing protein, partial [Bacteroidota bacterium]
LFQKRTPAFMYSLLALMKLGVSYIPLASDQPWSRLQHIFEEAQPRFILSQEPLMALALKTGGKVLDIDEILPELKNYPEQNPETSIHPDQLAYIIYTSGSTGQPKGVMISQTSLANYLQAAAELYIKTASPHFALFTALGFDLTITSLMLPLIKGGLLSIYEENTAGTDLSIFEVLEENAVDHLKLTPAHLALIRDKDFSQSSLKTLIVGGENFKSDLAQSIYQSFPQGIALFNEYGPTEATVGCIVHEYQEKDKESASVPIGKPFANCQAYILDKQGNPVPQGVTGELYLGGPGLALGYLNQDVLSQEKFIPSPFHPGARLYRSGDLVRFNPEGQLVFLGRQDDQIKIGGVRIELEEIEKAVQSHPSISEAVVLLNSKEENLYQETHQYCRHFCLPSNKPHAEIEEKWV